MEMPLRTYQQEAFDAAYSFIRKSTHPCVIDAATGAGKSHIIAALAESVHELSKKRVLVLAPRSKLVKQNVDKYRATGHKCSIYSASAGSKCLRYPVVFGTPQTISNSIERFGSEYALVIIDEAHGITPTIKRIIDSIKEQNPNIRVVGLTATPYRLGTGYIYRRDVNGVMLNEETQAIDPYFYQCVYKIDGRQLIGDGYLTPYVIGEIGNKHYNISELELLPTGHFSAESVDKAFVGHGRLTAYIVADVIAKSQDRQGVMFFAATIAHAKEIMASLPPGLSRLITGDVKEKERDKIYDDFAAKRFKYFVNVDVATTGFDAPHVDVIAILRHTESVALLQQIAGRGMRLDDDKKDFLILDYAENIETHCPDGDLFSPQISATKYVGSELITVKCPLCQGKNQFVSRLTPGGFGMNEYGYFIDLDGTPVLDDYDNPYPSHYGRRCKQLYLDRRTHEYVQCDYRWSHKECPHCEAENDIAARYCSQCKGELIDPNEKLKLEYQAMKADPYQIQTDIVLEWKKRESITKAGNPCLIVDYVTTNRTFSIWYMPGDNRKMPFEAYYMFCRFTNHGEVMPSTVTYRKEKSGFYAILGYNQPEDKEPE
jgi:DNA repair protein RadD